MIQVKFMTAVFKLNLKLQWQIQTYVIKVGQCANPVDRNDKEVIL